MSNEFKPADVQNTVPTMEELVVNRTPLQLAGQDEILREYVLGGPHSNRDVRLILDSETLDQLLAIAKSSDTRRVVIHRAGIKMKVRRATSGHVYETLHLEGMMPVPEKAPTEIKMPLNGPVEERLARHWLHYQK
mgnify:CR=1 FL=1|jgi:hypothetical protein